MGSVEKTLQKCELLVRGGQVANARRLLQEIDPSRLKLALRLRMANLARRTHLLQLGLRLLHPLVFSLRSREHRTSSALAEYAVLLSLNGNLDEAIGFLSEANAQEAPEALLAKSWCLFEKWDYAETLPLLGEYIRRQSDPYYEIAGRINFAEALLAVGDIQSSHETIDDCVAEAERHGHIRLCANALHIRSQASAAARKFEMSNKDLRQALALFGDAQTSDALLIHRQLAFNQAATTKSEVPIRRFRARAIELRAWASVRECEFEMLKIRFQARTYENLWYGTPYSGYRRRIEKEFKSDPPKLDFRWGHARSACLDLRSGRRSDREPGAILTRQNRALIDILLRDLYRPASVGVLFSQLFPTENYDAFSSPDRVHQCLKRLRQWLQSEELPLQLEAKDGFYRLKRTSNFSILISADSRITHGFTTPLQKLRMALGTSKPFQSLEASEILGLSKATTNRLLKKAIGKGLVLKEGGGRSTTYLFLPPGLAAEELR